MESAQDTQSSSSFVLTFISGFVFSVLVSSFVFISPLLCLLLLVAGYAILIAEGIFRRKIGREIIFIALVLISCGFGSLRYAIKDFHIEKIPSNTGIIISEPERRENDTRFVFRASNGEKVLVSTDLYSEVEYGDIVEVRGRLQKPGIIEGDDGRDFDYAKYLSKDDIYHTMSFTEVTLIKKGRGNPVKHLLFKVKRSFVSMTRDILPEPEASLLAGLLVSGKDAMPKPILEEFRRAGVVHIVVLSGYNITIISEFMGKMLRSAKFSVFGILLFVIMTGAEPTVVRASLMVLAVVLAKLIGRRFSAPRALLLAAFLMVLHNPKILVFDPSFQLSFLATSALIFVGPLFEKYLKRVPEKFELRSIVATTIATQLVVLPYLLYNMGDFSLVSLPANLLILAIMPYVMLTGFISTLVGFLSPVIAFPISFISHIMLAYILLIAHWFGNLKFATFSVANFSPWIPVLIYLGAICLLWRGRSSFQPRPNLG